MPVFHAAAAAAPAARLCALVPLCAMLGMTMIIGIVTEVAIFYVSELQGLVRDEGVKFERR